MLHLLVEGGLRLTEEKDSISREIRKTKKSLEEADKSFKKAGIEEEIKKLLSLKN